VTLDSSQAPVGAPVDPDTCPATISQLSLWFIDQLMPDCPVYNMSRTYRVQGPLDITALGAALTRVAARHEALRTTFTSVEGRAVQVINPPGPVRPRLIDLSDPGGPESPEASLLADACKVAVAEADRPFDLAAGPLLRCCVIRLAPADHLLVIGMHHIVADGWSLVVLASELTAAYSDVLAGRADGSAAPASQFGDAAVAEADWFGTEAFAGHLRYWRDLLAEAPRTAVIGADRPRRDPPTFRGAQVTARIAEDTVRALRELAVAERATLFMPALAAFALLLGRYEQATDVVLGVPVAGRLRREFEDVIGLFVNTLAIRADLSGAPTFRELLGRVRDGLLDAFAHQEVPFARIVEELNPERDLTHRPLVQVLFQYLGGLSDGASSGDEPRLEGTTVTTVDLPNRYSELDMEIQLMDSGGGLDLLWIYSTDLYDEPTIAAMAEEFAGLLATVAAAPDRSIADIDVLTPAERQRFCELEAVGPRLRVVDGNLQRCPFGAPGELVLAGPDLAAAALASPSQTAARFVPDPFAAEPGSRMYATGGGARYRRDGVIEILRPPSRPAGAGAASTAAGAARGSRQTELALAGIWAELLEVDEVGVDDDFFDLGGHSILAIRAIIALREKFDLELPLRAIFDAPTVASMARLLDSGDLRDNAA